MAPDAPRTSPTTPALSRSDVRQARKLATGPLMGPLERSEAAQPIAPAPTQIAPLGDIRALRAARLNGAESDA